MVLAVLGSLQIHPSEFFAGLSVPSSASTVERFLYAVSDGGDLVLHFPYGEYDAQYRLRDASLSEFENVISQLRDGLAREVAADKSLSATIKSDSVARTFLRAVQLWPNANPSDLWWFVVYRAYSDPLNHPALQARLDWNQSWKRTSGWALEEVLVRFYGEFLKSKGVIVSIAHGERKERLLSQLKIDGRLEADKIDVLLSGMRGEEEICFGAVHVKASFAERRTDDVPLSRALVEAGYASPLWTMDCKSIPQTKPVNRGELGAVLVPWERDRRSAKRKDIEDDGFFSACFSYNHNTLPTPNGQESKSQIIVCDFRTPDDVFSRFVLNAWAQVA
jgi:hypothetical protein